VEARRSPVRAAFAAVAVIMVYTQWQGGLTGLGDETDVGRYAALLALGAVMQLLATLAVTEACRIIGQATHRMADEHNVLVERRDLMAGGADSPPAPDTRVAPGAETPAPVASS
jgi:hypothetical protein